MRNPVGIAAGKLVLAIEKEHTETIADADAWLAEKVRDRALTLLQASRTSSVSNLLDGRSVPEYLDSAWVEAHPAVKRAVEAFVAALNAHDHV